MNHRKQLVQYIISDLVSVLLAWTLFYTCYIDSSPQQAFFLFVPASPDQEYLYGIIVMPIFWVFLFYLAGFYRDLFRRSRLKEFGKSVAVTFSGILILFITMISINLITDIHRSFLSSFTALFYINFLLSYIPRAIITSRTISAIRNNRIGFNTLIIGSDKKSVDIYLEITEQIRSTGNKFVGFVNINGNSRYPLSGYLPHLGGLEQLPDIITKYAVEEVIIAIEMTEHNEIGKILSRLDHPGLIIKAIPGIHDILSGRVRINTIIETPLIQVSRILMPLWQQRVKQLIDILGSVTAMILLFPVSIFIMIWIKLDSKGPVIYSHERIGKNGKPFTIYKFRTMIDNAEKNGPELSSPNDRRITRSGRFLRRTRMDEIPNFINVLKGEMSLVGPRPERKYYIDQINRKAPHYNYLLKIKPGITSWGQVKFGYAEDVEQMIQRLKYDIIYLDNMSLFVDIQILILTLITIFKRKGV